MQAILILLLIAAVIVDVSLVVYAFSRPDRYRTSNFVFLCLSAFVYTLGYLVEIMATTQDGAMVALRVENFGIPMVAPFFFLTAISLFRPKFRRGWQPLVALLYGFAMFLVVFFNDHHHLYYTSTTMYFDGTSYFVLLGRGPLYVFGQVVSVCLMLFGYGIIAVRFARGSQKLRRQMFFFVVGSLIGFVANVLNFSGLLPIGLDPTPFALMLGLICFSVSLFRDGLMDIVYTALNTAVATLEDAFVVLDAEGDFLYCNQSARMLFPKLAECQGTEAICTIPGWPTELAEIDEEKQLTLHLPAGKGDELRHYRSSVESIRAENGKLIGWSVLIRDITEESRLLAQLEEMATTDPLTGILNRRQLFVMAERELGIAKRHDLTCAIILFDVDHFKRINDTYGHSTGDEVLRQVTRAIEGQLRVYDIFGRVGGEEFVVFAQGADAEGMEKFAARLRETLEDMRIQLAGVEVRVTASFGVAEVPVWASMAEAVQMADSAMYAAKAQGRNRVVIAAKESPPS